MVLPTLNAHATTPKILENFANFHWISPFCMVRSRKKQCYVSIFFAAFCNVIAARRLYTSNLRNYHWICPICMTGQQEELCLSLVLHSTSQWIRAEAILNAELCYSQDITNHHVVIFKAPPSLIAHATRLKSLQISIRSVQSAW